MRHMDEKLIPNEEEARLLELLTNDWWHRHAPARGVKDTTIDETRLTKSGVVVKLLLNREMTMPKLKRMLPQIRTLLDIQDDHQTDLLEGGRASKVALAVRTRRVTDTMNMTWRPGITSIGVDTITGEEVRIPLASQIQVAGAKGYGKSWAIRPLIMAARSDPTIDLTYLDPKMVEGSLMKSIIRTAVGYDAIFRQLDYAHSDMWKRADMMSKAGKTVWDTKDGPTKILIVDEGRDLLAAINDENSRQTKENRKQRDEEQDLEDYISYHRKLIQLSSMGRAWGYFIWWLTQYPTVSSTGPGIDRMIDVNADYRLCLRLSKAEQSKVALAEDADYGPHLIPAGPAMRGHAYLGGHGPTLIRTWTVTDEMISGYGGGTSPIPSPGPVAGPGDGSAKPVMELDEVRAAMGTEVLTAAQVAAKFGGDVRGAARILTDLMIRGEIGSRFNGTTHEYGKSLRF